MNNTSDNNAHPYMPALAWIPSPANEYLTTDNVKEAS